MVMFDLLRRFPTIWQSRDTEGCTALHAAASAGAMDMGQLLVHAGVRVRERDNDGWEALHYACANGHYGMAAWLLQSGADLSAQTDEGWQPVHVAAHTGQTQLARYLAAQGADLGARTKIGHEAVHLATDAGCIEFVQWIIRVTSGAAAFARCAQANMPGKAAAPPLRTVLSELRSALARAPLHERLAGAAMLQHMILPPTLLQPSKPAAGHPSRRPPLGPVSPAPAHRVVPCPLHLSRGLHPPWPSHPSSRRRSHRPLRDADGWMPVHNAAHIGSLPLLKLLLNPPAPVPPADINGTTNDGCTPLHLAAIAGQAEAVQWLVQKGSQVGMTTSDGLTAAALARLNGQEPVAALLEPRSADISPPGTPGGASGASTPGGKARMKSSPGMAGSRAAEAEKRWVSGVSGTTTPSDGASVYTAAESEPAGAPADGAQHDQGFYLGLSSVLTRTENKAAATIQRQWRSDPYQPLDMDAQVGQGAAAIASQRLLREVQVQAAHYIDSTLSRALVIKHLKLDLATLMEKGRVYTPPGASAQLVAWRLRFFFCSDEGLCYQKVASTMRPYGDVRLVRWGTITKVEALLDDSIYVETVAAKKYYLRPKGAVDAAVAAWTWATRLCQLAQLLGTDVAGYVAAAACRHEMPTYQPPPAAVQPLKMGGKADQPTAPLLSTRLPSLAEGQGVTYMQADAAAFPTGALPPAEGDEGDGEEEEGEETAEEAYRRQEWIKYYVSVGQFNEAADIGWEGRDPADPRGVPASAPLSAAALPSHSAPSCVSAMHRFQGLGAVGEPAAAEERETDAVSIATSKSKSTQYADVVEDADAFDDAASAPTPGAASEREASEREGAQAAGSTPKKVKYALFAGRGKDRRPSPQAAAVDDGARTPTVSPRVVSLGWLQQRMAQISMRSTPSASGTMTPVSGISSRGPGQYASLSSPPPPHF